MCNFNVPVDQLHCHWTLLNREQTKNDLQFTIIMLIRSVAVDVNIDVYWRIIASSNLRSFQWLYSCSIVEKYSCKLQPNSTAEATSIIIQNYIFAINYQSSFSTKLVWFVRFIDAIKSSKSTHVRKHLIMLSTWYRQDILWPFQTHSRAVISYKIFSCIQQISWSNNWQKYPMHSSTLYVVTLYIWLILSVILLYC